VFTTANATREQEDGYRRQCQQAESGEQLWSQCHTPPLLASVRKPWEGIPTA
jgi:hypothetical protein